MIGPLAQRQIHLVSNVEALRASMDVAEQQTREVSRKRAADDRLAEAQTEVPQISEADALRTEERHGRQQQGHGPAGAPVQNPDEEVPEPESLDSARNADGHLDFLA